MNRLIFILTSLILLFVLLACRLFYLQYFRADDYYRESQRQQQAVVIEKPQRGIIVDRVGRILAASNKIETVFVEPRNVPDVKDVASRLGDILDLPGHEICGTIYESKNYEKLEYMH